MGRNVLIPAILITLIFLISLVNADSTFFDSPDYSFVIGNPSTTDSGITSRTTNGGGCKYEWNCTNWSECLPSGKQIRNCVNIGSCSDTYKSPEIEKNCTYAVSELEKETEKKNEKENQIFKEPLISKVPLQNSQQKLIVFIAIGFVVVILIGYFLFRILKLKNIYIFDDSFEFERKLRR